MLSLVSLVLAAASLSGNGFWVIGVVMLAILALGFTRYRYVLGYFVLGMLYWLAVEGVQWLLSEIFALESPASYVAAIGFSMLPVLVILVWAAMFMPVAVLIIALRAISFRPLLSSAII